MDESANNSPTAPASGGPDQFDALRKSGADQFDTVGWHYLALLAKRAEAHQGDVKRMLDARLAQALTRFKVRFDQAQCDAAAALAASLTQYPESAKELQRRFDAADFKGLRGLIGSLTNREAAASLGALVRQLQQHAPESIDADRAANPGSRSELKALRNFRNTWSKLSANKQLTQALEQAPANAGPINSHMLVLHSLAMMRAISPDYLNRFMSYADTLLSLDQCEKKKPPAPKKQAVAKAPKK